MPHHEYNTVFKVRFLSTSLRTILLYCICDDKANKQLFFKGFRDFKVFIIGDIATSFALFIDPALQTFSTNQHTPADHKRWEARLPD